MLATFVRGPVTAAAALLAVTSSVAVALLGQLPPLELPALASAAVALGAGLWLFWRTCRTAGRASDRLRQRALAGTVAVGLGAKLAVGAPTFRSPGTIELLLGGLTLLAVLALAVPALVGGTGLGGGRRVVWGLLGLVLLALSGPGPLWRVSLGLSGAGSWLSRDGAHSLVVVALLGLAITSVLGGGAVRMSARSSLLETALVVAVVVQVALGIALRHHAILLWPHVLVALAAVLPLAMRSSLQALLSSPTRRPALSIAVLLVVVLQLGLGIASFVLRGGSSLGDRADAIGLLVTAAHLWTGLGLLVLSIAVALESPAPCPAAEVA